MIFTKETDNIIIFDTDISLTFEAMLQIQETGVRTVLAYLPWYIVEPQQGVYNWEIVDQYVNSVKQAGLKLILRVPHSSPTWMPDEWYFETVAGSNKDISWCNQYAVNQNYVRYTNYWNQEAKQYNMEFIKIACERYNSDSVLCVSCLGTFGEHPYPTPYVDPGDSYYFKLWCFGKSTVDDFRDKMLCKYKSIHAYNYYNNTSFRCWQDVKPADLDSNIYSWADTIDWYNQSWYNYLLELQDEFLKHTDYKEVWISNTPNHGFSGAQLSLGLFRTDVYCHDFENQMKNKNVKTNQIWTSVYSRDNQEIAYFLWVARHWGFNLWVGAETAINIVENSKKSIKAGFKGVIVGSPVSVFNNFAMPINEACAEIKKAVEIWNLSFNLMNTERFKNG